MGFLDRMVGDMVTKSTGFNARGLVRMVGGKRMMVLGGAALAGALMQDRMQGSTILGGASSKGSGTSESGTRQVPRSTSEMRARMATAETVPLPPLPTGASTGGAPAHPAPPAPPAPPGAQPPAEARSSSLPPVPGSPESQAVVPPPPPGAPVAEAQPIEEPAELPGDLVFAIMRTMVAASLADGTLDASEREMITARLDESGLSDEQIARVQKDLLSPAKPLELAGMVAADDRELLFRFATLIALADDQVTERERTWLAQFGKTLELSSEQIAEIERDIYG